MKESKWIKVRKGCQMPKLNETVLIIFKPERDTSVRSTGHFSKPLVKRNGKFVPMKTHKGMWCETKGIYNAMVTYWQPFPEFP
jgi:hypothetical protein